LSLNPQTIEPPMSYLRRRQYRILIPIGIALCLSLAGDLTLYAVLPLYASNLGLSLATLGVLLSANRLIRLGSNPVVGWLSGHFRRRSLILTSLALGTLSTLLYVLADGFTVFLIGRILWGISWSMLYIGIYCIMFDITSLEDRGWGSGLVQTFYFAGLALNPLLGGFLSDWIGFANALLACTGLQGFGLVLAFLFLPETHPIEQQANPLIMITYKTIQQGVCTFWNTLTEKLSTIDRKSLAANYLYMLTLFIGDGIIMSTLTLYLTQRYGEAITLYRLTLPIASAGGILLALRAVVSTGVAPLAGFWSDRGGLHWLVSAWGTFFAILGCIILAIDGRFSLVLIGIILSAWGGGMLSTVLPVIVSSTTSPAKSGFAIGVLTTSGDLGCALAPLASYALLGSIGLSMQYLISAGLLLSGGIIILAILKQSNANR
jgi:MFS family permease